MKLRRLEEKDAPFMLEWMHDEDVVRYMKADFASKTIDDCKAFIEAAKADYDRNLYMAIVDASDEYLGTVSLKHIENGTAEFGITIRKKAMGQGASISAMREILKVGFDELHLSSVFWCVNPENIRALRFYDKNGFERCKLSDDMAAGLVKAGRYSEDEIESYVWYIVEASAFEAGKS